LAITIITNLEILAKTCTFYSSSNNNNNDFLTIKKILCIILQKKGFITKDQGLDNTVLRVKKIALKKRSDFINYNRSVLGCHGAPQSRADQDGTLLTRITDKEEKL
jgi:hypothetical protein